MTDHLEGITDLGDGEELEERDLGQPSLCVGPLQLLGPSMLAAHVVCPLPALRPCGVTGGRQHSPFTELLWSGCLLGWEDFGRCFC